MVCESVFHGRPQVIRRAASCCDLKRCTSAPRDAFEVLRDLADDGFNKAFDVGDFEEKRAQRLGRQGNTLFRQQKYRAAAAKYSEAIELTPTNANLWNNRACCHAALKDWDECWEGAAHATTLKPDFDKAWRLSAKAQWRKGLPIVAKHVCTEGLQHCPESSALLTLNSDIDRSLQSTLECKPAPPSVVAASAQCELQSRRGIALAPVHTTASPAEQGVANVEPGSAAHSLSSSASSPLASSSVKPPLAQDPSTCSFIKKGVSTTGRRSAAGGARVSAISTSSSRATTPGSSRSTTPASSRNPSLDPCMREPRTSPMCDSPELALLPSPSAGQTFISHTLSTKRGVQMRCASLRSLNSF